MKTKARTVVGRGEKSLPIFKIVTPDLSYV